MLFSSYEFLLVFLPAAWFAYVVMGRRSQHAAIGVLLVFSLFFYALWSSIFLLILLGSIAFNFTIGIALSNQQKQSQRSQRGLLAFGVTGNLVLLAYFKYVDFFGRNIAALLGMEHATLGIVLPLGISFYTFTQIAFLVDAYRSEVREYRPLHYVLFVTYFPQLIAGPILHHKEMMPQLSRNKVRAGITAEHLCLGFGFLSIGLFKKLVVADSLAGFATPIFDAALAPSFIEAWIAALAYTFQLYFDFSGYSDMAIGISLMFGIWLPLNFNSPYKASSIAEFWRRWHMTLSRFLRDYLYIPLGGGRKSGLARSRNLMITMVLGGMWHGAGWTFVVWGALHGIFLMVNHLWRSNAPRLFPTMCNGPAFRGACWALTFLCVVVGWVFFRAPDLDAAISILKGMAGLHGLTLPDRMLARFSWLPVGWTVGAGAHFAYPDLIQVFGLLLLVALATFLMPNTQQILLGTHAGKEGPTVGEGSIFMSLPTYLSAILTATLALVAIGHISALSPFLYFQF